ncbi:Nucleotidyltransferase domain protein [Phycisphaerae bacterium RAS2]|nr:Nucleotidyltransferase domain protein [Phycisphaerae bacterium RAS2]
MTIAPRIAHSDIRHFAEDRVNLPADIAKERRQKVNELRERLAKWMKDHPECGIAKSYLSGSLAKGTALKTSSDVDVALYINYDGEKKADRRLADWIAERLRKAYPQMKPEQIEPQEYSVKIKYREAGIDVDIVPVFYEGDPQDKGWLVSKKSGRLMLTSIPMHLAFTRKRKDAQPQHFAQVVRLAKWWATEQKGADANFRFKSFMVELICAHLADNGQSMADYRVALEAFFNYIVKTGLKTRIAFKDHYPASELPATLPDPIQIFDPVNPKNNVASQYTENNRRLIVTAAQDALDALNEAHTAATKGHAVQMWQVVLGSSFRG